MLGAVIFFKENFNKICYWRVFTKEVVKVLLKSITLEVVKLLMKSQLPRWAHPDFLIVALDTTSILYQLSCFLFIHRNTCILKFTLFPMKYKKRVKIVLLCINEWNPHFIIYLVMLIVASCFTLDHKTIYQRPINSVSDEIQTLGTRM